MSMHRTSPKLAAVFAVRCAPGSGKPMCCRITCCMSVQRRAIKAIRPSIPLLTKPGDLVVDPFAGSGTTGIAALQLQRRCLLIDNHYPYCVLAAQRIRAETGVHASGEYLSAPVPARARLTLESQAAIKRTAHAAGP